MSQTPDGAAKSFVIGEVSGQPGTPSESVIVRSKIGRNGEVYIVVLAHGRQMMRAVVPASVTRRRSRS